MESYLTRVCHTERNIYSILASVFRLEASFFGQKVRFKALFTPFVYSFHHKFNPMAWSDPPYDPQVHFIIPTKTTTRPQVMRILGPEDYLCQITDSTDKTTLTVRVVFVYRNGFRRRRLVTSLLDPTLFPASELANLYHMRWDIETFYREFKHTLQATSWHCKTPTSFHQELLVHMIALCLIRTAMLEASRFANVNVGRLSFSRALTETRLFLKFLLSTADLLLWSSLWTAFVQCCSRHRVKIKPDRHFPRDRQQYRKISRGVVAPRRKGRKHKSMPLDTPEPEIVNKSETRKDSKNRLFLLS